MKLCEEQNQLTQLPFHHDSQTSATYHVYTPNTSYLPQVSHSRPARGTEHSEVQGCAAEVYVVVWWYLAQPKMSRKPKTTRSNIVCMIDCIRRYVLG